MDTASKSIASVEQLDDDAKKFIDLYEHIVKRYKLKYNTLDVKAIDRSKGNNDMEIGLVKEGEGNVEAPICEQCESNDLDAFGKGGKGTGKGKNDGMCNVCGGDGHFTRNCPLFPGPDMGKMDCFGCNGKGHRKDQCPVVNPHQKGKGSGSKAGSKGSG